MTTPPPDADSDDAGTVRPFAAIVREFDKGRVHDQLSEGMRDLIAAVLDTNRAGTIGLAVKVEPGDTEHMVKVQASVTVKPPRPKSATSLFYVDDDHNPVRQDPRQQEIPGVMAVAHAPAAAATTTPRRVNDR